MHDSHWGDYINIQQHLFSHIQDGHGYFMETDNSKWKVSGSQGTWSSCQKPQKGSKLGDCEMKTHAHTSHWASERLKHPLRVTEHKSITGFKVRLPSNWSERESVMENNTAWKHSCVGKSTWLVSPVSATEENTDTEKVNHFVNTSVSYCATSLAGIGRYAWNKMHSMI